jgi:uncharacterized protein
MSGTHRDFSLLIKPTGADCNLACDYCFYLPKSALYPGRRRMDDRVLETLVRSYMATEQEVYSFGWQGGEPTLMGAAFFRKVVELQSRYGRPGAVVANGLQTNATHLEEPLAALLAEYRFLVGVSLDGPPEVHDRFRRACGGQPTHAAVLQGIERLRRSGAACNALTAVSAANVERPEELYRYLRELGIVHLQYVPIVELDAQGHPLPFSIGGRQWGEFLCGLYDAWLPDAGRVSVRLFDALLARLVDGPALLCTMGTDCRQYFLVEHNGDVYPCDFFVQPELRLGNIREQDWGELLESERYRAFGRRKSRWPQACADCEWLEFCAGDCLKHRLSPAGAPDAGQPALSLLCEGWQAFFAHALPGLRRLARRLARWRTRQLLAGLPEV